MSMTTRFKLRMANLGPKNHNWEGGKTNKRKALQNNFLYRSWRKRVYERDDYTCQICGIRGGELNADHIMPVCIKQSRIYDITNGRTLCHDCHTKTDTFGQKARTLKKQMQILAEGSG